MNNANKIKPECNFSCPLKIDISGFIKNIAQNEFLKAIEIIREQNPFPGIVGRICPAYCENACIRKKFDESVAIKNLERFCADYELEHFGFPKWNLNKKTSKDKSVAIIGSGPAGLACAYYLLKEGYDVDIYEKYNRPGGMLSTAIPQYKLPRDILFGEIQIIEKLGGKFISNCTVGKNIELTELRRKYDALFISIGAGKPAELHIPGKNLDGVFTSFDFLEKYSSGNLNWKINGSTMALVFGGNEEAFASARILRRLGAEVHIFLPAEKEHFDPIELRATREENIIIEESIIPTAIFGTRQKISSVRCLKIIKLNEDGKIKMVPIKNSEFDNDCDIAIFSVRRYPDISTLGESAKNFNLSRSNTFIVDENSQTNIYGIFAGGEAVMGQSNPIVSLADGKRAAISIDNFLTERNNTQEKKYREEISQDSDEITFLDGDIISIPRNRAKTLAPEKRDNNFREIEISFDREKAIAEAKRCIFDKLLQK